MDSLFENLITIIREKNMLTNYDSVIVAVSGGADSAALLHLLLRLKKSLSLRLRAVHVNHGLRGGESEDDEDFVRRLCAELETELDIIKVDILKEAERLGIGVEDAGRRSRYAAFEELRAHHGFNKIAVAHNKNDNAETVLMWILRGAGLRGLCGIPAVRGDIIRPLLWTSRSEIEEYCRENGIAYRTDSSNLEEVYQRNRLRLKLIPLLSRDYNPSIIDALNRMSHTLSKDNDCLEKLALEAYQRCILEAADKDGSADKRIALDIVCLKGFHEAVALRVIRLAVLRLGINAADLYMKHYEGIYSLLDKPTGKKIILPGELYAATEYNKLILGLKQLETRKLEVCFALKPDIPVYVKEFGIKIVLTAQPNFFNSLDFSDSVCTKEFSYDKIYQCIENFEKTDAKIKQIVIRNRRNGDRIYVASMGGRKRIKDYLNSIKLPADLRDSVPLVACGLDIIWILDGKSIVSDRYKAKDGDAKVYIHVLTIDPDKTKGAED